MQVQTLLEEINQLSQEIQKKKKQLAEMRKEVPEQQVENYVFTDRDHESVTLSELFLDKDELIVIHNMGVSCNYCTLWADGFNGVYHHLIERAAFVVSTPDEPRVQEDIAAERGWKFPMVSTKGTTFKQDMGYADGDSPHPGVSTFRKDEKGNIYHHAHAPLGPGDDFCAVWHLFDLLPKGQAGFVPKRKINQHVPLQLTNNVAVQVNDYSEAVDFYKNVIGMKVEKTYDSETKMSMNGTNLFIEKSKGNDVFFEFSTDDFENMKSRLLENGCKITEEHSSTSIMVKDPYGLNFHLFESSIK
ncbi:DUF899 family protein [Pseudalkalibacillus sp. SCS-8]|uniref:DUF899 family protein n=1 Tax=Pseudalkalibacillus nanhaiensis TaxID=3115291 RepID=UPI0032D9AFC0